MRGFLMPKKMKDITFLPSEEKAIWKIEWEHGINPQITIHDSEKVSFSLYADLMDPGYEKVYRKDLKVGESVTVKNSNRKKIATVTLMR
jgi:hypothetical protein